MTLPARASLAMSLMATAAVAVIIGLAERAMPGLWVDHLDEIAWLALPPAGGLIASWFGRNGRPPVPGLLLAATGVLAVVLAGVVLLAANGHGYLGARWQLPVELSVFRVMAGPTLLTLLAGAAVARDRWRSAATAAADPEAD